MEVALENIRQAEGIVEALAPLKEKLERRLNLSRQVEGERAIVLTVNKVMRICLITSLSLAEKRSIEGWERLHYQNPPNVLCPVSLPKTTKNHYSQRYSN